MQRLGGVGQLSRSLHGLLPQRAAALRPRHRLMTTAAARLQRQLRRGAPPRWSMRPKEPRRVAGRRRGENVAAAAGHLGGGDVLEGPSQIALRGEALFALRVNLRDEPAQLALQVAAELGLLAADVLDGGGLLAELVADAGEADVEGGEPIFDQVPQRVVPGVAGPPPAAGAAAAAAAAAAAPVRAGVVRSVVLQLGESVAKVGQVGGDDGAELRWEGIEVLVELRHAPAGPCLVTGKDLKLLPHLLQGDREASHLVL
mmetsp:Transcript_5977/g.16489  ORF Transcript_5977/g.16489 Transcript_5977/m.16489 type:complete len:258 (+) Transcript_5977:522-1295(+)